MPDELQKQNTAKDYTGKYLNDRSSVSQGRCTDNTMDPFSIFVGSIAIVGAVAKTASTLKRQHSDYRDAESDAHHVQHQRKHLLAHLAMLDDVSSDTRTRLDCLRSSLDSVVASLPSPSSVTGGRKRDRLRWAAVGKAKAKAEIERLKDIESSANIPLLITIVNKMGELSENNNTMNACFSDQLALYNSRLQILEAYALQQKVRGVAVAPWPNVPPNPHLAATMSYWNWLICLGITLRWIVSGDGWRKRHSILLHWHLFYHVALVWRISLTQGCPSGPYVSLRPRTVVPSDSAIIKACKENNLALVQKLFVDSEAHVTDVTLDNLTILHFAIRAGHWDIVKFLLENGADANQTFGARETSPLNNAFLTGRADLIRLLLSANGDLNYVNNRTWTSIYYLWDPELNTHARTSEILDICVMHQFDGWQFKDLAGWAPIHRVAAFGEADHIKKLFNLGVIDRYASPLTVANWCPLQCAARFGNLSTFQYLISETLSSPSIILEQQDSRGWSLLHLAAAGGSEKIISYLLSVGFDPTALSDPSGLLVPEELEYKNLTPRTIAKHYGHGITYDHALRAVGLSDYKEAVSDSREEIL